MNWGPVLVGKLGNIKRFRGVPASNAMASILKQRSVRVKIRTIVNERKRKSVAVL